MGNSRKKVSAPALNFFLTALLRLVVIGYAVDIPTDWKSFIDPDILQRDLGSDYGGIYGNEKFEGDIAGVFKNALVSQTGQKERNVINGELSRWPRGVVPYRFPKGSAFTPAERIFIIQAMQLISALTYDCITFVRRTTEDDYISFFRGVSCSSSVGRQGGKQPISLVAACMKDYGQVQHEIMHALGFYHELSRSDRDNYIIINFDNINSDAKSQFDKHAEGEDQHLPYDYESVMHYPFNAFAVDNRLPVLVPKIPRSRIGQSKNLSPLDVLRIQRAYRCETIPDPKKMISSMEESKRTDEQHQTQPNVTFPIFGFRKLTVGECRSMDSPGCRVAAPSFDCTGEAFIDVNCQGSPSELVTVSSRISELQPDRPVRFVISERQATPEVFAPVRALVIGFAVGPCQSPYMTQKLPELHIPNLLYLAVRFCDGIIVRSQDFDSNPMLRQIDFVDITFNSIEVGTFASLSNLRHLAFECGWKKPFSKEAILSILTLHCSCEYSWLRTWLDKNPRLIALKAEFEVFKIGELKTGLSDRTAISVPVNCNQKDLNNSPFDPMQVPFSVNDPCS